VNSKNFYRLKIKAICPVDVNIVDEYETVVSTREVISVETILEHVTNLTQAPIFQEHLTRQLAASLRATVETTGVHSGIEVTAVAKWKR